MLKLKSSLLYVNCVHVYWYHCGKFGIKRTSNLTAIQKIPSLVDRPESTFTMIAHVIPYS